MHQQAHCVFLPGTSEQQTSMGIIGQWAPGIPPGHRSSLPVTGWQWAAGATRHPCQTLGTSGQHQAPIQFLVGPFITERICFPNFTLLGLGVGLGIDEPVSESVHDSSFI